MWSDEAIETLRKMRGDGLNFRACAELISQRYGWNCTRNAAIGKARRIGIGLVPPAMPAPKPVLKPMPAPIAAANRRISTSRPVTLMELTSMTCRWPIGDPRSPDFGFCGVAPEPGLPYCKQHCRMAYRVA